VGDPKYPNIVSFPLNITGSTPLNLTATDFGKSGISAIYYKVNYENIGNWNLIPSVTYSGSSFSLTGAEGNYSIRYWAVDNVLNQESFTEIQVIVDNSPPVSSIDFLDPNYRANATSNILNITNFTPINITSVDGGVAPVGVDYIEYMVDDDFDLGNGNLTGWITYSDLFTLNEADGDYMIYYHAVDLLGNIEPVKNTTIILDSSPPLTQLIVNGINYTTPESLANNTWWIIPQTTLIISGTDQGDPPVGFNITDYWVDGVSYRIYDGYIELNLSALPNGSHELQFRSIDHLTNMELSNSFIIIIDDAGPDMDITSSDGQVQPPISQVSTQQINFTEQTTLDIDAMDMGVPSGDDPAGVAYREYLVGGDPYNPGASWQLLDPGVHSVFNWTGYWHNNISFRAFDNLEQPGPIVTLWIYIEGDVEPPKPPVLTLLVEGNDVMLEWSYITAPDPDISHYLIYRSTTKTGFDFRESAIWVDTRDSIKGRDPVDDQVIPLRSSWNDTGIISDNNEYYYIIRAVDQRGNIGYTSNIAGWVTLTFEKGYNSFSLPLEPFDDLSASQMLSNDNFEIERDTLFTYDAEIQQWVGHAKGMPYPMDNFIFEMGESYMIYIAESEVSYIFTGATGTSIRFIEGVGENEEFQGGLSIRMTGDDDIELSWTSTEGATEYVIYKANVRFDQDSLTDYSLEPVDVVANTTTSWSDDNLPVGEHYYMVVARSEGRDHSGTYAVGVQIMEFSRGYSSFSFALDPKPSKTIGSFAVNDLESDRDSIYYYDKESGSWLGHPRLLPENINTGNVVMGSGYLVFTDGESTKVAIIGI
jgi:hypothetical protein